MNHTRAKDAREHWEDFMLSNLPWPSNLAFGLLLVCLALRLTRGVKSKRLRTFLVWFGLLYWNTMRPF
jgi:hypothetical protein